jgi:hypothetical protein
MDDQYLLWLDILGTRDLYTTGTPEAVIQKRKRLEELAKKHFEPILDPEDFHLYVFSDTVMVTAHKLPPLLKGARGIMHDAIKGSLEASSPQAAFLLRGAIAKGWAYKGQILSNSCRVQVIPFIGSSLPVAYELEGLRKGSRLYIEEKVSPAEAEEDKKYILDWKAIPGEGRPAIRASEYLWPSAYFSESPQDLASFLKDTVALWRRFLQQQQWNLDEYKAKLLPFDETAKLCVRSCREHRDSQVVQEQLLKSLPQRGSDLHFEEYEWGLWFLIIEVLISDPEASPLLEAVKTTIRAAIKLIQQGTRWGDFTKELGKEDYSDYRKQFLAFLPC